MNNWIKVILVCISLVVAMTACQKKPRKPRTMEEILSVIEDSDAINRGIARKRKGPTNAKQISRSLLPRMDMLVPTKKKKSDEKKFDIAVKDVAARQFFMGLVAGTPYSMVVSPQVAGTVSLNLKNVTIEDALNAACDAYGFEFERTSYGYRVMPAGLQTKVYHVNYLNITRQGQSLTRVTSGQLTDSDTGSGGGSGASRRSNSRTGNSGSGNDGLTNASVGTNTLTDFWPELKATLLAMIGTSNGRSVVVSPQAGIVVVRAYPNELRSVEIYLNHTEKNLNRQVILEAKILEVRLNDSYQSGIDWTFVSSEASVRQGGLTPIIPVNGATGAAPVNALNAAVVAAAGASGTPFSNSALDGSSGLTDFNGIFAFGLNAGNFSALVKLLETQGNVQVLSSPRISTVNNQKAVIKVGQDEFFVTEVSGNTSQGTATTNTTQNVELTPFFSGISLDVTPHIDKDGTVILHIHPTVSDVSDNVKTITVRGTNTVLPLALSSIRESDNIVRALNGQVVVIGGLMQTKTAEVAANTPFIGEVPLVGTLFKRTEQIAQKSELVILLRPIVIGKNTWSQELRREKERLENLNRGFHFGSKPRVFDPRAEFDDGE